MPIGIAETALFATAMTDGDSEEDKPGFLRSSIGVLAQSLTVIHNALTYARVLELLVDDVFTDAIQAGFDEVSAAFPDFNIDNVYIPFGNTNPGFKLPKVDLLLWIGTALNIVNNTASLPLTEILDLKIPFSQHLYYWNGTTLVSGTTWDPDRKVEIRDMYTLVVIRRFVKHLKDKGWMRS